MHSGHCHTTCNNTKDTTEDDTEGTTPVDIMAFMFGSESKSDDEEKMVVHADSDSDNELVLIDL